MSLLKGNLYVGAVMIVILSLFRPFIYHFCNCLFSMKIPDLKDPDTMQKFFLQEIQIGEELLANGKRVGGFMHAWFST